ncbi:hypothetical protein CLU81_2342 [Flavobacterium sp. 9]|nr:hypothetical protein CLU81_2342 [Flavobacterium sp. 9]
MKTTVTLSEVEGASIGTWASTSLSLTNKIRFYPRFYEVNLFYPRQN